MKKKLPIGIESFDEFFTQDFYYVDKTDFIKELLQNWGKVNLFTRPRRFGKSLNMSMLKCFLEIGCDKSFFHGLNIMEESELCKTYMGQFPVISISLKDAMGTDFEQACIELKTIIGNEASRFSFLADSNHLSENEKNSYRALTLMEHGEFQMSKTVLTSSLQTLSALLTKHFGQKSIILIDEYDVPLDKAFQSGFYDEMTDLIRNLFSKALKSNEYLQFSVLTGCLRISKESIFTGLNNPKVHTIADYQYNEYFGFTQQDVEELLAYYDLTEYSSLIKEWYDGYQFGDVFVYCPWDVINYCCALLANRKSLPKNYWANTSGNAMIRRFLDLSDKRTKQEIEQLIAGKSIIKKINLELTYNELEHSIENLWSVLFTTGYLTQRSVLDDEQYELVIPNREIRSLFVSQIQTWFQDFARQDAPKLQAFCNAIIGGHSEQAETLLNGYLWNGISIRDTAVQTSYKENFYHGMLLGLLQYEENWLIRSNEESGTGYCDILIETQDGRGVVIEVKYAADGVFDKACGEALQQIEDRQYTARLQQDGMKDILKYGIAFYQKKCMVMKSLI